MRALTHEARVVHYPVQPGSETTAPIWAAVSLPRTRTPRVVPKAVWPVGFAEGQASAVQAAIKLAEAGFVGVGLVLPFADVVLNASSIELGLDHLVTGALPYVSRKIAPRRATYFGGNSVGGGIAIASGSSPACEALAVVSPLAPNRSLGRFAVTRKLTVAWRLAVKTPLRNHRMGQEGIGIVARGAKADIDSMGLRKFLGAAGYTFSDRTQAMIGAGLVARRDDGRPTAVFTPDQDDCFCPAEYRRMFGALGCEAMLRECIGPHATMVSEIGQQQVEQAATWLQEAAVLQGAPVRAA